MKYKNGQIINIKSFSIQNNCGGTEIDFPEGEYQVRVNGNFYDYEVGDRYNGYLINEDDIKMATEKGTTGYTPEHYKKEYGKNSDIYKSTLEGSKNFDPSHVYFSEHEIIN